MSRKKTPKLFLIDGTALAYRSHFAFANRPLLNSQGRNVGAIFAYTGTLMRILRDENPDLIAVAFDRPEPTFRHEKFPEYKATRDKTPDELVEQIPDLKAITEALGVRLVEKAGWEADDLIGTLAARGAEGGCEVYIVAGDKDFMQLVSQKIKIFNISRADSDVTIQDVAAVRDKFGVPPEGVVDVLGLMGDSSDNVPGVPGVGVKTAIKLISEHGSMDGVYENLDRIKSPSLRKKLGDNRDLAFLSRELVVIDCDAPIETDLKTLDPTAQDTAYLQEKFIEFEFNTYISYLDATGAHDDGPHSYTLVDDAAACDALLDRLAEARAFAFDTETTSLNPRQAEIVGLSIAIDEREAFYIPAILPGRLFANQGSFANQDSSANGNSSAGGSSVLDRFLEGFAPLLADSSKEVIGQNLKYDLAVLRRAGISSVNARLFDTMVAHYLCHPGEMQHGLDFLSLKYLGVKKIPTADLIGKGKKQITMADVPVDKVCEYACEDVDMTLRLRNIFARELDVMGLTRLFDDLEMPLLLILEEMEHRGLRVDRKVLDSLQEEFAERVSELTSRIYELAGEEFNINSTQQLGKILFDKLEVHKEVGLKRVRKTKTGYSTNAAVLESISAHPLGHLLLEYRRLQKLNSTYVEALPRLIEKETGCIHTSFNQAVAATGRLSSSDPNLQNIPIRTPEGGRIREAFVPRDKEWRILSADYSQVELRILAHISGDAKLQEAFREGKDIHAGTASLIFGVAADGVTPELRSRAKTINFGIIYGMGPQRLARETGISFAEAKDFIDAYFETFPGVKGYIDSTLEQARETGYVTTLLGRKRAIDDMDAMNQMVRASMENVAVNTPIQGTAADLIKKAMLTIPKALADRGLRALMVLQVHDELVFDVPEEELDSVGALVKNEMESAMDLDVPLVVDIGSGSNWREAH